MYVDSDWFIDLSYHWMLNDSEQHKMTRLITKEQYLPYIPSSVNKYACRLQHLHYFINLLGLKDAPTMTLDEFLNITNRPKLVAMFNSHLYTHRIFDTDAGQRGGSSLWQ